MDYLYVCNKQNNKCGKNKLCNISSTRCMFTTDKTFSKTLSEGNEPIFKKSRFENYKNEKYMIEITEDTEDFVKEWVE